MFPMFLFDVAKIDNYFTGGMEPDGQYAYPGGLFIPSITPDQQRRQQHKQQSLQKPRSQAIPIVSPTVS